ncbi:DUF6090 family protein [Lacinutrix iliipiscaria]|uniref:DUF6090 family protein n=1 Tax=Lacinutrix iliipiscaria TaxID=1230532 RepID=A0ABW5WP41_9FLAO
MIKFFRKIRQNLLTENKFSKYLLYAIGEIILVVIGILIALSINNWNEDQRKEKLESKILSEIRTALKGDLKAIKINVRSCIYSEKSIKLIKEQIQLEQPTNDSLNYHFGGLLFNNSVDITTGPFETLKSQGLDLISNDSLRNGILYYYEQTAKYYIDKNLFLSNEYKVEYFTKLFNTVAFMGDYGKGQVIPNDYESLKKDPIFFNIVNTTLDEIGYKRRLLKQAEDEVQSIIKMINKELQ